MLYVIRNIKYVMSLGDVKNYQRIVESHFTLLDFLIFLALQGIGNRRDLKVAMKLQGNFKLCRWQ